MNFLFSLLALAAVSVGEVQTFKHVTDVHFPHTHEHREGSAKGRGRDTDEVA